MCILFSLNTVTYKITSPEKVFSNFWFTLLDIWSQTVQIQEEFMCPQVHRLCPSFTPFLDHCFVFNVQDNVHTFLAYGNWGQEVVQSQNQLAWMTIYYH